MKQNFINSKRWRRENKCKHNDCKKSKYLSIHEDTKYCIIHLVDFCDDIVELPEDVRQDIKEILSLDNCHLKSELVLKLKEQKKRIDIKRLNILSEALN